MGTHKEGLLLNSNSNIESIQAEITQKLEKKQEMEKLKQREVEEVEEAARKKYNVMALDWEKHRSAIGTACPKQMASLRESICNFSTAKMELRDSLNWKMVEAKRIRHCLRVFKDDLENLFKGTLREGRAILNTSAKARSAEKNLDRAFNLGLEGHTDEEKFKMIVKFFAGPNSHGTEVQSDAIEILLNARIIIEDVFKEVKIKKAQVTPMTAPLLREEKCTDLIQRRLDEKFLCKASESVDALEKEIEELEQQLQDSDDSDTNDN